MDDYIVTQEEKDRNKELCEKYPFLIPSNRWSGKLITTKEPGYWPGDPEEIPEWDYEYTELDEMPDGWRKAFGEQLCEELKEELVNAGCLDSYRITQVKEKFGALRWYDNGCTGKWYREILPKYERLSARTCIRCGKPATKISTGWISPFCNECAGEINCRMIDIDEYFGDENSKDS